MSRTRAAGRARRAVRETHGRLAAGDARVPVPWIAAISGGAAIGAVVVLAIAMMFGGCYPRPPTPPPSCAADPTQPWCAAPALSTRCTRFRVDIDEDAGVRDELGVWHYPARATAAGCPDGGAR